MIAAASLVLGAVLFLWAAPYPLSRLTRRTRRPGLALTGWMAVTAGAAGSLMAGAGLLVFGDRPHVDGGPLHNCWAVLGHTHVHPADEIAGLIILTAGFAVLCRVLWFAAHSVHAGRRAHEAHLRLARHFTPADTDGVLWLAHEHPFAYSVSGRPGMIVASTALRLLPATQRDAVLAHERRHLRGRHHALVLAARAACAAVPRLRLLRSLPGAVEELTERIADAHAAKVCGPEAVHEARAAVGYAATPGRHTGHDNGKPLRAARLLAGAGLAAAPALSGAAIVTVAALLAC